MSSSKPRRVTAVVCAAFDPATDEAVLAVRDVVRSAGVRLPDRPPHRPHFSLGAARVEHGDLPRVLEVAAAVARSHRPIPVRLGEVGRFGRAGVVWLGPSPSPPALLSLQRDVDAELRAAGWPPAFGERSDPAQWIAHCTLATRVAKPLLRKIQADLEASYRPIAATVDALATILVGGSGDVGHARLGADADSG
jgi:2'-5' RNA ligase